MTTKLFLICTTILCAYPLFLSLVGNLYALLFKKETKLSRFVNNHILPMGCKLYYFDDNKCEFIPCKSDYLTRLVYNCIKTFTLYLFIIFVGLHIYNTYNHTEMLSKDKEYQYQIDSLRTVLSNKNLNELIGQYHLIKNTDNKHLTKQDVYDFAVKCEAWYPEIIANQAVIESAGFSSSVFRRTNNLFGMKQASVRKTTRKLNTNETQYAEFYNWQLSVIDRILWDYAMFDSIPTREEYLNKLQKIYAEDEDYINKIK